MVCYMYVAYSYKIELIFDRRVCTEGVVCYNCLSPSQNSQPLWCTNVVLTFVEKYHPPPEKMYMCLELKQ